MSAQSCPRASPLHARLSQPLCPSGQVAEHNSADGCDVVVMLHTLWRNGSMYTENPMRVQHLANHRILAPDLLGHGHSPASLQQEDESGDAVSIECHALSVVHTIRAQVPRGTPLFIVGYSISAAIALVVTQYLLAAREYPVRGVVLVAPVYVFQTLEQPQRTLMWAAFARNRFLGRAFATRPFQMYTYYRLFERQQHRDEAATNPDAVYDTIKSVLYWCPAPSTAAVRAHGVPVLILDGQKDPLRWNDPKRKMLMRHLGAQSARVVVPGSDHALMGKTTGAVYKAIAEFIQQQQIIAK